MALTYSPPGELGSLCPPFNLPSVEGAFIDRADFKNAKALVVMFICNHCPYVKAIEDRLISLRADYAQVGVAVVGICSNNPKDHPEDQPEALRARALAKGYGFPYLVDADQTVARAFAAVCTPDLFVYDADLVLRYRGRLDDSWRDASKVSRHELREALDAILQSRPVASTQNPTMGCSIKW